MGTGGCGFFGLGFVVGLGEVWGFWFLEFGAGAVGVLDQGLGEEEEEEMGIGDMVLCYGGFGGDGGAAEG